MNRLDKFFTEQPKKVRIFYAILIAVVFIAMATYTITAPSPADKQAMILIEQNFGQFKSPESANITDALLVDLESGTVVVAKVSAVNSFGARTSTEYIVADGIMFESSQDYLTNEFVRASGQELNLKKLNKAIDKKFGKM